MKRRSNFTTLALLLFAAPASAQFGENTAPRITVPIEMTKNTQTWSSIADRAGATFEGQLATSPDPTRLKFWCLGPSSGAGTDGTVAVGEPGHREYGDFTYAAVGVDPSIVMTQFNPGRKDQYFAEEVDVYIRNFGYTTDPSNSSGQKDTRSLEFLQTSVFVEGASIAMLMQSQNTPTRVIVAKGTDPSDPICAGDNAQCMSSSECLQGYLAGVWDQPVDFLGCTMYHMVTDNMNAEGS